MTLFGIDPNEIEDAIKRIFGSNGSDSAPPNPEALGEAPVPGSNQADGSWYRPFDSQTPPSSATGFAGLPQPSAGSSVAEAGADVAAGSSQSGASLPYDMSITHRLEGTGTNPLVPYVLKQFPGSGATIGHGIDLSRLTASDLRQMHMSEQFIAQVSPFLAPEPSGVKGGKPVYGATGATADALEKKLLDPADIDALQQAVDDRIVARTRNAYDGANPAIRFDDLDPAHRTALIDMGFNRGPSFGHRKDRLYKDLWNDVISGNWDSAAARLDNDNGPYAARSRQQACIIRTGSPCSAQGRSR